LDVKGDAQPDDILIEVNDEEQDSGVPDVRDQRIRRLGQIVDELGSIPTGPVGARGFEKWVLNAIKILFSRELSNAQLQPNPGAVQQRDVVATNVAERGFWRRIRDDYDTRQVVFEIKNYEAPKSEDFRQVLSYSGGHYGRFAMLVTRSDLEAATDFERSFIKELWDQHRTIVMPMPAKVLARCIKKMRAPKRQDYAEDVLSKQMDVITRSYLSLHAKRYRRGH